MLFYNLIVILLPIVINSQMTLSPFMGFLHPDNVHRMTDLAVELSSLAARSIAKNEKDVAETVEGPREIPLRAARPSEILGQAVSDITTQSRMSFLKAFVPFQQLIPGTEDISTTSSSLLTPTISDVAPNSTFHEGRRSLNIKPIKPLLQYVTNSSSEIRHAPKIASAALTYSENFIKSSQPIDVKSVGDTVNLPSPVISKPVYSLEQNPLFKLASTFLQGATQQTQQSSPEHAMDGKTGKQRGELFDFGGLRDYVPGANNNFGLRKGPGCLPFLSEFMQVAYGNCQKVADEKAFDAWGDELKSAIYTGQIDLLKASQETCRRGAERQQCGALRRAISNCEIMESIQIGAQLQRAMKRCEEMGGLLDQNPLVILSQINNLVGGELAQGFLNKFLSGSK